MKNKLLISQLKIKTTIGVYAWEKQIKQTIILDLELPYDSAPAASHDSLDDALDYAKLTQDLTKFCEEQSFQLIETLAMSIRTWLIDNYQCEPLHLQVSKPGALPNAKSVTVVVGEVLNRE